MSLLPLETHDHAVAAHGDAVASRIATARRIFLFTRTLRYRPFSWDGPLPVPRWSSLPQSDVKHPLVNVGITNAVSPNHWKFFSLSTQSVTHSVCRYPWLERHIAASCFSALINRMHISPLSTKSSTMADALSATPVSSPSSKASPEAVKFYASYLSTWFPHLLPALAASVPSSESTSPSMMSSSYASALAGYRQMYGNTTRLG